MSERPIPSQLHYSPALVFYHLSQSVIRPLSFPVMSIGSTKYSTTRRHNKRISTPTRLLAHEFALFLDFTASRDMGMETETKTGTHTGYRDRAGSRGESGSKRNISSRCITS